MNERQARELLDEAELIPAIQGPLRDVKRMRDQCLAADIPVDVLAPPGKG
jgi:hypothetical protein